MGRLNRISVGGIALVASGVVSLASVGGAGANTGASFMELGGRTSQPIGHYEFCRSAPGECRSVTRAKPHQLSRADWQAMVDINNSINSTILPKTDMQIWGREELWSYPTSVGDCEDFVLLKRHMLIKRGISPSNLLITVVKQPNGEGHAVLTVRTDHGEFVLDNLTSTIKDWRDTPYKYLKRQSSKHAGRWVTIHDSRSVVASIR
ncbi:MAG: transglutaminase-like cysteine peptidase [Pseudomonadota bacterium]